MHVILEVIIALFSGILFFLYTKPNIKLCFYRWRVGPSQIEMSNYNSQITIDDWYDIMKCYVKFCLSNQIVK